VALTEPGFTNRDSSTAPTRPPPLPCVVPPGLGEFGPGTSPQQDEASPLSASSKVTISRLPCDHAGEPVILGTSVSRKLSAAGRPPGPPSAHEESCASWHRSGVMNAKVGVVAAEARSVSSWPSGTSFAAQAPESIREWKYTKGLWRAAYWLAAVALCVWSTLFWPGRWQFDAMSSMYPRQVSPLAASWSATVFTACG
jgi:hypothetical protein